MIMARQFRSFKVTPQAAVKFTRLTVYLTCIWPPTKNKSFIILFEVFFLFSVVLALGLLFPLIISIRVLSDNIFAVMKSAILISGIVNFLIKVFAVRIYRKDFQTFAQELDDFLHVANDQEREVLQNYVDKCWKFQGYTTCTYYLSTIGVLMGPLILPQKFPSDAIYPFPVDTPFVSLLIYIHQSLVGFQCSAGMTLDCQAALFIWYIGARFEMLARETRNVKTRAELYLYIQKHQKLLLYAERVIRPIRFICLTTVTMTKVGMVFGAIMLVSNQPYTVKLQFVILVISAAANIFVCVWAAENLLNTSTEAITHQAFYTAFNQPPKWRKIWLTMISRAQKPVVIKLPGFLDALSFEFYSSFISLAFSYFTTLHAAVGF